MQRLKPLHPNRFSANRFSLCVERRPIAAAPCVLRLPPPPAGDSVAWRRQAGALLAAQRPRRFTGEVEIAIALKSPVRAAGLDGSIAAILALLVAHGVLPSQDNRILRRLTAHYDEMESCRVEIVPAPHGSHGPRPTRAPHGGA